MSPGMSPMPSPLLSLYDIGHTWYTILCPIVRNTYQYFEEELIPVLPPIWLIVMMFGEWHGSGTNKMFLNRVLDALVPKYSLKPRTDDTETNEDRYLLLEVHVVDLRFIYLRLPTDSHHMIRRAASFKRQLPHYSVSWPPFTIVVHVGHDGSWWMYHGTLKNQTDYHMWLARGGAGGCLSSYTLPPPHTVICAKLTAANSRW